MSGVGPGGQARRVAPDDEPGTRTPEATNETPTHHQPPPNLDDQIHVVRINWERVALALSSTAAIVLLLVNQYSAIFSAAPQGQRAVALPQIIVSPFLEGVTTRCRSEFRFLVMMMARQWRLLGFQTDWQCRLAVGSGEAAGDFGPRGAERRDPFIWRVCGSIRACN